MMEPLTQQLQRFVDDERAVSPVVGFVLIFALVMMVFTMYQADVVPAQNKEIEFEHSQTVEGQMNVLNGKVGEAVMTDTSLSATVDTGVQYPSRALAINPGTPIGALGVIDPEQNVSIDLDGDGYWSEPRDYSTKFVSYQPRYNLLQEETAYTSENGMLVKDYSESDNTGLESAGVMFSDSKKRLNLVLLNGSYSTNQPTSSLTISPVVTNTSSIGAGETGTITVPTTLSEDHWKEMLEEKGYVDFQSHTHDPNGFNTSTISIEAETEIHIKKATAGDPDSDDSGRRLHLENETALTQNASVNGTENLTVSVRDQFGAVVSSNASITATTSGAGNLTPTETTADSDGRATFSYTGVEADSGSTVNVDIDVAGGVDGAMFELNYPAENSVPNGTNREPLSVATGSLQSGPTDLIFRINPGPPVDITGFSVTTKDDGELRNLTETTSTNEFHVYRTTYVSGNPNSAGGLHYRSSEPIQFDGQDYTFEEGPRRVASSEVHLKKFDQADGITFTGFADSYKEADIVVYFITEDGKRPVYITATMDG